MYNTLIIDGSYLAYSRFCAGANKESFVLHIRRLMVEYEPMFAIVAWDSPDSRQLRQNILPTYKSKRSAKPEDYFNWLKEYQEILPWFNVCQKIPLAGEGDDAIATIVRTRPGRHLIWSVDKDMLQLVSKNVHVMQEQRQKPPRIITMENIVNLTGLTPEQWLAAQALGGDTVDGIPGLSRVGKKTAAKIAKVCPEIVQMIIEGNDDDARMLVAQRDVSVTKYVEQAIREREQLDASLALVTLQAVGLKTINTDEDQDKASDWLRG